MQQADRPPSEADQVAEKIKQIDDIVVGRAAVDAVAETTDIYVHDGDLLAPASSEAAALGKQVEAINTKVVEMQQNKLRAFTSDVQKKLGRTVLEAQPPQFLLDSFGTEKSDDLFGSVLNTPLTKETQPRLSNFYEWRTWQFDRSQQQFQAETLPKMVSETVAVLRQGEANTTLPKGTADRFIELLDSGGLRIVSTLAGKVASKQVSYDSGAGFGGAAQVYKDGSRLILLTEPKVHILVHEALHVLSPVQFYSKRSGERSSNSMGLERVFGTGEVGKLLNEAATEHGASAALYGNVQSVHSAHEHRHESWAYKGGRDFLNFLCYEGAEDVPPQLFVAAMLDKNPRHKGSATIQLKEKLGAAFPGVDIIKRLKSIRPLGMNSEKLDGTDLAVFQYQISQELQLENQWTKKAA